MYSLGGTKAMVRALIFAGGTGQRMNSRSKPKQFLELNRKPILIYTLEFFEYHPEVEDIIVVCLESWENELKSLLNRYGIHKVSAIVPGGNTGHDSIYCGLQEMAKTSEEKDIVLIHDGVRPLISEELISQNIAEVRKFGNAITAEAVRESVVHSVDGKCIDEVPPRDEMYVAKAPQSFYFGDILEAYDWAETQNIKSIDSAHLLSLYGKTMHMIPSSSYNIKITTPADYYMFRALYEAIENQQIFGL